MGKSTYLKRTFPESIVFDFLKTDLMLELTRRQPLLGERLLAQNADRLRHPIILDKVQKVPEVLDEVHWLVENRGLRFILCGSSARKLRQGRANLLGGRAWRYEMFPLVSPELGAVEDLDLLRILRRGTVPDHYQSEQHARSLDAYVRDYLKEEVFAEGLTRNFPAFTRFLDVIGPTHGELTNYANIARDCGVDAKTVRSYYEILVDTLLGRFVEPYARRRSRQVITRASKFYLFDVGVGAAVTHRAIRETKGEAFGRACEHFIFTELAAHASYSALHYPIRFWRTKSGLEVDFVLGEGEVALEVKGLTRVDSQDLRGLKAFVEEHRPRGAYVVCNEPAERLIDGIRVTPWREFLRRLWAGKIVA